jgi:hypothetical protein
MESPDSKSAYFEFITPPDPDTTTFTIKLTDAEQIAHARRILSGKETPARHVSGIIVKTPAPYNPPWKFHLSPESIHFFEVATEVCDATIQYVADHLAEVGGAFLPGNRWCPWSSQLVREVKPQSVTASST